MFVIRRGLSFHDMEGSEFFGGLRFHDTRESKFFWDLRS